MNEKIAAEEEKRSAESDTRKAKKRIKMLSCDVTSRLAKWRYERDARRQAADELTRIIKESVSRNEVLERYKTAVEASEGKKKQMKKEWKNDEAASRKGGGRSWPVWVVQLVCELSVNGTPHRLGIQYVFWFQILQRRDPIFTRGCDGGHGK